jgi:TfoX/Sxy family transcriptional regulator of competence genes
MPGFAKSPPELVARFHDITDDVPGTEHRQMFGYPALFVGGNLVSGLYESSWFVRLGAAKAAELMAIEGAGPVEIMPGRSMAGYVAFPATMIAGDEGAVRAWLNRAIEFGQTLPPKPERPRKAPKTKP